VRKITSWILLLLIWQIAATLISNDVLLPKVTDVLARMAMQISDPGLYSSLGATMLRVLLGFMVAFILALLTGILSSSNRVFREYFHPVVVLTNTIPNITYMFMALIWLGAEGSVAVIVFFILYPVLYQAVYGGMLGINPELLDVAKLYPETFFNRLFKVTLPLLGPALYEGARGALSLGLKVGVMAEILGQVQTGIGHQLYLGRVQLDMAAIFAWTAWMILLSLLIDVLFRKGITAANQAVTDKKGE
jgi:NitT/TauT family transport system permease protein